MGKVKFNDSGVSELFFNKADFKAVKNYLEKDGSLRVKGFSEDLFGSLVLVDIVSSDKDGMVAGEQLEHFDFVGVNTRSGVATFSIFADDMEILINRCKITDGCDEVKELVFFLGLFHGCRVSFVEATPDAVYLKFFFDKGQDVSFTRDIKVDYVDFEHCVIECHIPYPEVQELFDFLLMNNRFDSLDDNNMDEKFKDEKEEVFLSQLMGILSKKPMS